jgi:hypothetical protein
VGFLIDDAAKEGNEVASTLLAELMAFKKGQAF